MPTYNRKLIEKIKDLRNAAFSIPHIGIRYIINTTKVYRVVHFLFRVSGAEAMGHVSYNPDKCAGCNTCMTVCSLYHEGVVNLDVARIQVVAPVLKIFEAQGYVCKQCRSPECLYACPKHAVYLDIRTGARVIDPETCDGCNKEPRCIEACIQYPNSPIKYDVNRNICVKCDLCDGDPLCVKFCPKSVDLTPHLYPEKDRVLKFVRH